MLASWLSRSLTRVEARLGESETRLFATYMRRRIKDEWSMLLLGSQYIDATSPLAEKAEDG